MIWTHGTAVPEKRTSMSLINREVLLSFEKMDADLCATCGEHHTAEDVIMMIKTAPTVDAVPVVRCEKCVAHENCLAERVFVCAGIENPFCCAGKREEGAY